ncbi:MAG: ATP-binding protein, partial [Gallionellaceae bacterium]|nr:ATP-binding protein [Gallionellaceae bacterium]
SDALIEPEAKAFEAVAKGDLKTASFLVYGPKYLEVKKLMADLIQEARVKVETRLTQRKVELTARAALLSNIALIALIFNAIVMLAALMFFFRRKVVTPMNLLTDKTQKLIDGDNQVRFGHEDDTTELGDLARALEGYRLAGEKAEHQHKINQVLAEIEQALQSVSTFAEFGDILSERLAPIMGLVYAALYLADKDKTHLRRVGGYGCDDTIHATGFAWGQSLVGQAALDQRQISLALSADDNVDVSMGMGKLYIRNLLISPIMDRDMVLAVLELGTLQTFDSKQMLFLEALLPNMAEKIQILAGNVATRELLEQTQQQAQALAASELQMAARRDELEASQVILADSRATMTALINSIPDLIFYKNHEGVYLGCNDAFGKLVGRSASEITGKTDYEIFPKEVADFFRGKDLEMLSELKPYSNEEWVDYPDGSHVMLDTLKSPFWSSEGKLLGLLGISRDVTERQQAAEKLRMASFQSEQALDLTKSGYWHVPLDGSGWFNSSDRAIKVFGDIPREDCRYRIMEEWFANVEAGDKAASEATLENFSAAVEGRIPEYNSIYAYKRPIDGKTIWIHALGRVVKDAEGKSTDMYGVTVDITESKLAEDKLRAALQVAEDATKAKSDFLANMSHEIRTPMNAIIGMSHLALQTDLNSKQRNYIEKVDSAAKNLLGIINDILDFSKIEAGKMSMEKVNFHLEDVLEHLSDLSVIKAQDKGLELLFDVGTDVPTALVGDSLRLGQVVINLVNNAIKFTEKGEITVGIHKLADTPDGVQLRFTCKDTGIGLTGEQRKKLFSAFSQADASTTRKYGGTGLGLTISKKIVEMMQGEIGVDSVPGEGSTFHFTAIFGVQSEQRKLTVSADDVKGLRILVVDDNASAREILQNILASLKFEATAVSSGAQAIGELEQGHLEHRPYGLVLMDWMMPGMDGVETIRRIRADKKIAETPAFVMVTAYSREELLQSAADVQIDGILVKPVSPSTLLDSILNALGKEVANQTRKHEKRSNYQEAALLVKGSHLLLVEDNEVNQELALEILQDAGLTVDVANNGKIAVEKVALNHYDA